VNIKDILLYGQLLDVNIAGVLGAIKCCYVTVLKFSPKSKKHRLVYWFKRKIVRAVYICTTATGFYWGLLLLS